MKKGIKEVPNFIMIPIENIKENPNNPRVIKNDKYKKLVKSIQDFPQMLELRPLVIDESNIVLGGNMRLKVLRELKYKNVPCVYAKDLSEEQKKEFVIKDNSNYGSWDYDMLSNNYDVDVLNDWGVDVLDINDSDISFLNEQKEHIDKIEAGECPTCGKKTMLEIRYIVNSNLEVGNNAEEEKAIEIYNLISDLLVGKKYAVVIKK